jgi:hypothetical protein
MRGVYLVLMRGKCGITKHVDVKFRTNILIHASKIVGVHSLGLFEVRWSGDTDDIILPIHTVIIRISKSSKLGSLLRSVQSLGKKFFQALVIGHTSQLTTTISRLGRSFMMQ